MKLLGNTAGECAGNFRSGDILQTGKIHRRKISEGVPIKYRFFFLNAPCKKKKRQYQENKKMRCGSGENI